MSRKGLALWLAVSLLCIGGPAWPEESSPTRVVSEKLLAHIELDSIVPKSLLVHSDSKRVAYVIDELKWLSRDKYIVVVDGEEGKKYDGFGKRPIHFSPDGKRVAYGAREGKKWMVVVDGKEGKKYDGFGASGLFFSPDGKRVAYSAKQGDRWSVVVDGEEGKKYDEIGERSIL